jgi:hypothetical protein
MNTQAAKADTAEAAKEDVAEEKITEDTPQPAEDSLDTRPRDQVKSTVTAPPKGKAVSAMILSIGSDKYPTLHEIAFSELREFMFLRKQDQFMIATFTDDRSKFIVLAELIAKVYKHFMRYVHDVPPTKITPNSFAITDRASSGLDVVSAIESLDTEISDDYMMRFSEGQEFRRIPNGTLLRAPAYMTDAESDLFQMFTGYLKSFEIDPEHVHDMLRTLTLSDTSQVLPYDPKMNPTYLLGYLNRLTATDVNTDEQMQNFVALTDMSYNLMTAIVHYAEGYVASKLKYETVESPRYAELLAVLEASTTRYSQVFQLGRDFGLSDPKRFLLQLLTSTLCSRWSKLNFMASPNKPDLSMIEASFIAPLLYPYHTLTDDSVEAFHRCVVVLLEQSVEYNAGVQAGYAAGVELTLEQVLRRNVLRTGNRVVSMSSFVDYFFGGSLDNPPEAGWATWSYGPNGVETVPYPPSVQELTGNASRFERYTLEKFYAFKRVVATLNTMKFTRSYQNQAKGIIALLNEISLEKYRSFVIAMNTVIPELRVNVLFQYEPSSAPRPTLAAYPEGKNSEFVFPHLSILDASTVMSWHIPTYEKMEVLPITNEDALLAGEVLYELTGALGVIRWANDMNVQQRMDQPQNPFYPYKYFSSTERKEYGLQIAKQIGYTAGGAMLDILMPEFSRISLPMFSTDTIVALLGAVYDIILNEKEQFGFGSSVFMPNPGDVPAGFAQYGVASTEYDMVKDLDATQFDALANKINGRDKRSILFDLDMPLRINVASTYVTNTARCIDTTGAYAKYQPVVQNIVWADSSNVRLAQQDCYIGTDLYLPARSCVVPVTAQDLVDLLKVFVVPRKLVITDNSMYARGDTNLRGDFSDAFTRLL